ncbi:hypothetical protein P4110_11040 [Pseudomonas aeruginosa]|nr:hypothetical protein [Pseudomonas aeruginosa]
MLCLTASFGVASLDGGGQASYEQLYSAADQALYRPIAAVATGWK